MKLLERERPADDGTPEEPAGPGLQEAPAPPPETRACASCGAALEDGQEWCLDCGAAAGPVSDRAGWRPAMAVLGLTLLLVTGAVAAAFAALSDDPARAPIASNPAAQAPVTPPATTPATTPTAPEGATTGETGTVPEVDPPSSTSRSTPSARPVDPVPTPTSSTPSPTPTPAPSTGSEPQAPSSSTPSTTPTTTTPQTPPAERIDLEDSDVSVYDPYGRALATGAPGKAIDGDAGTSWYVDTTPGAAPIGIGYAVNLGRARGIRRVEIATPTPGFRVEVYATDEATPPPNILDSRWAHIIDRSNVGAGGDGAERIVLGAGTSKYQNLLLWITRPPESGARVRFAEVRVYG